MKEAVRRRGTKVGNLLMLAGLLTLVTVAPRELLSAFGAMITGFAGLLVFLVAAAVATNELDRYGVRELSRFARWVLPWAMLLGGCAIVVIASATSSITIWWPLSSGDIYWAALILQALSCAVAFWLIRKTAEHTTALGWWPVTSPKLFTWLSVAPRALFAGAIGWLPAAFGGGPGADVLIVLLPLVVLAVWEAKPRQPMRPLILRDIEASVAQMKQLGLTDLSLSSSGVGDHEMDPKVLARIRKNQQSIDAWVGRQWERCGGAATAQRVQHRMDRLRQSRLVRIGGRTAHVLVFVYLSLLLALLAFFVIMAPRTTFRVAALGGSLFLGGLMVRLAMGSGSVPVGNIVGDEVRRAYGAAQGDAAK